MLLHGEIEVCLGHPLWQPKAVSLKAADQRPPFRERHQELTQATRLTDSHCLFVALKVDEFHLEMQEATMRYVLGDILEQPLAGYAQT